MRKLILAAGLTLLLAAVLLASDWHNRTAAPPPAAHKRLALAQYAPEAGSAAVERGLLAALAARGWREGENLQVVRKDVNGIMSAIPSLLQELDAQRYDLIVTLTTPVLTAACNSVTQTPVVFAYVTDALAAGAGHSDTDHLPRITGVATFDPIPETLDVAQRLLPRLQRVGLLYNSSDISSQCVVQAAQAECARRGLTAVTAAVASTNEVQQAVQGLVARGIDLHWFYTDNTALQAAPVIMQTLHAARIPVIVNERSLLSEAVACVGVGWEGVGERAGEVTARVLAGESPAAIPLQRFVSVALVHNPEQCARLGLAPASGV